MLIKDRAITLYDSSDEEELFRVRRMGIAFDYVEIKNGEWLLMIVMNVKNVKKTKYEIDQIAKSLVRKPKKVKPGYKRNMSSEMDK